MNDDLNTPLLLSHLFEAVRLINSAADGSSRMTADDIKETGDLFNTFVFDILGLTDESENKSDEKLTSELMKIIMDLRLEARNKKEWAVSDHIRAELKKAGIMLNDTKDGVQHGRGIDKCCPLPEKPQRSAY